MPNHVNLHKFSKTVNDTVRSKYNQHTWKICKSIPTGTFWCIYGQTSQNSNRCQHVLWEVKPVNNFIGLQIYDYQLMGLYYGSVSCWKKWSFNYDLHIKWLYCKLIISSTCLTCLSTISIPQSSDNYTPWYLCVPINLHSWVGCLKPIKKDLLHLTLA